MFKRVYDHRIVRDLIKMNFYSINNISMHVTNCNPYYGFHNNGSQKKCICKIKPQKQVSLKD